MSTSSTTVSALGCDGFAGVWASNGADLYRYDAGLTQRDHVTPFGANAIATLTLDPFDGDVWVAYGTTAKGFSLGGSSLGSVVAEDDIEHIVSLTREGFDDEEELGVIGTGVRLEAVDSAWEIAAIWLDSPAEAEGLSVGDELVSINGVSAPSISASDVEIDDFREDVLTARSGGVDEHVVGEALERDSRLRG